MSIMNESNGDSGWWIILLFIILAGWNGNNGYGGNQGAANNYVLASDFATIQRQLSDGFGGVEKGLDTIRNGLCDGFYTEAQLVNGVNTNIANLGFQMQQCCCDTQRQVERGFADTNYNMATQHCQTLQAIDKVGDRVIDYLNAQETQRLRDENNALRLSASQVAQNNYLISQLGPKAPIPAYLCNPCTPVNTGCGCA